MNLQCAPAPVNKRDYITDIGKILVKDYGKKKYYKPEEVKKAHKKSKSRDNLDFPCWGMSTFSSHSDFNEYHQETGEACNYVEMRTEMLEGISLAESVNWVDVPDVDLDASWLDFGEIFGGVLEGIGEFFAAIVDS